jgi:hypothetical protein
MMDPDQNSGGMGSNPNETKKASAVLNILSTV